MKPQKYILLILFFLFCNINSLLAMDKAILEKNFEIFQKTHDMKLIIYFPGFENTRSVFYGKSGPPHAEDVIDEIKVFPTYVYIKYTNRGRGEYFNDLYISITHITVIQTTKTAIEIYLGTPKILQVGK